MELFQIVRLLDVFVIGPAMIKIGTKEGGNLGTFIVYMGLATIIFNGLTFLKVQQKKIA